MINREGFYVGEFERECTICRQLFPKGKRAKTMCNQCNSTRVKSQSVEMKMLRRAKARAAACGRDFNLEVEDIVIPTHCPILGMELKSHSGRSGGNANSPALDRIDNTKGYVKGNVMVMSHRANMMKVDASNEELLKFAKWVIANHSVDE